MGLGADRVRPVPPPSPAGDRDPPTDDLTTRRTLTLVWLRLVLPWVMAAVLLAGVGGGVRLAASLGQPFAGFALMWRKEIKVFVVSNVTPPYWTGIAAGMKVNDRIRCIDGYMPSPESVVYGLYYRGGEETCPNGGKNYFDIFRQRYSGPAPAVTMLVERQYDVLEIGPVPITLFDLRMLLESFLPSFVLGLGFLALGIVVFRADSTHETNVVFALFAVIVASFAFNQAYSFIITPRLAEGRLPALVMVVLWMPFLGAVIFHLIGQLTPDGPLSAWNRRLRRPYYLLSAVAAAVGALAFVFNEHPLSYLVGNRYVGFVAASLGFAALWSLGSLGWTFWHAPSRRVRRQTGLITLGMVVIVLHLVPYAIYFVTASTPPGMINSMPYLGLALVAILAYAILRYQVFASRARVLTSLLVTIVCILAANLVYLLIGQQMGILPIMAATLLTALALETRQGPTSFFNRLLRREMLDYQTVVQFSEQVGQLQKVDVLLAGIRQPLYDSLDIEHMVVWLFDPAQPDQLQRFVNGAANPAILAPGDLMMTLLAHPDPMRANHQQARPLRALAADCEPIAVWAPLVERGEVAGLLGLGPRWTGEVYGERDLQLIGILARQLALSILNTRQLERLQAMSQLITQAEENERRKIARELHDTILQFLLVLTYGLDDLKERQTALTTEIERWQDRISVEAGQLRSLLSYLRAPEMLVQQGLIPSLQNWLAQVQQETAMAIETDLAPEVEPLLSTEAKVAIFRVCREAVHNAIKHSGGSRVEVKIWRDGEAVCFSVEDDGCGFDVDAALTNDEKGYSSLQDLLIYMESVGGQLKVWSAYGEGVTIKGSQPNNRIDLVLETGNDKP